MYELVEILSEDRSIVPAEVNKIIDKFEEKMVEKFPVIKNYTIRHRFADGLYSREILMPAGSLITSKIHKKSHFFFVMSGVASVWSDETGQRLIEAPYSGTTPPGTRRILYIHKECIWGTVHATSVIPDGNSKEEILRCVEKVEAEIMEKHDNPLLTKKTENQ